MKKKLFLILTAALLFFVLASSLIKTEAVSAASCGGVDTAIIECGDKESGIGQILKLVINILSIGVGILAVIGITVVGIQYLTAGSNEEQVRKSKRRLIEIVIGIIAYVLLYALIQWLIPGSANPDDIPYYEPVETPVKDPEPSSNSNSPSSEKPSKKYEKITKKNIEYGKGNMPSYWLNVPNNATNNMPLLVFLHGSGERGNPQGVSNLPQVNNMMSESQSFISIAPVLKSGAWTNSATQTSLKELIEKIKNDYEINPNKIYIMGFSLGAQGVWKIVNDNSTLFKAAAPMSECPISGENPSNFTHTRIIATVGSGETVNNYPKCMGEFIEKIVNASGNAKLEVFLGKNHPTISSSINYQALFNCLLDNKCSNLGNSGVSYIEYNGKESWSSWAKKNGL